MLILYHDGAEFPIPQDDYYIKELASGLDEVEFSVSIWDDIYPMIYEEAPIVDRGGQRYLVKQVDGGASTAKVIAQLDLDEWKSRMLLDYSNESATVYATINAVKPSGWMVADYSGSTIRRTIEGNLTPLEVCQACVSTYGVYVRWDNARKTCSIYTQTMGAPVGAFATRELNLREINYKGKSTAFATRLYAYGKKDENDIPMTLQGQTINGEVYPYAYVEDTSYADKIISVYWQDDRYTDPQSLYDDALAKLREMALPERSYDCSIVDLQATNPEKYGNLDFSLFTAALLIDDTKETSVVYQVVERHIFPYYPEKNEVIFSKAPARITHTVTGIAASIESPNGDFRQQMETAISNATSWLTSADGYVVAMRDENGEWKEILLMDTNDPATALHVLRMNTNGIGFSRTGINGPYTNAWTIDGSLVADFITTGTLNAGNVDVINLNASNITTGTLSADRISLLGKVISADDEDTVVMSVEGKYYDEDAQDYVSCTMSLTPRGISFDWAQGSTTSGQASIQDIAMTMTSGSYQSQIWATGAFVGNNMSTGRAYFSVDSTAARFRVTAYDSSGTVISSDERLKHDIRDLSAEEARGFLMGVSPAAFKYNDGTSGREHHGFIAQQVKDAMGAKDWGVFVTDPDGYHGVRYEEIIADLVAVVQDQERRIKALEEGDDGK